MKSEVIKQAFRLGNSAGVLLPIEWRNRKVAVKLIDKSITQEIFEMLDNEDLLANTMGVFLAGSYARGEEDEDSDIDILVLTDSINKQVRRGKYEILFISKDRLDKVIGKSLYVISLINEAKAIVNNSLLERYKSKKWNIQIKRNLKFIKSLIGLNEKSLEIYKELNRNVGDGVIYSLVLRLRELYLIECIISGKKQSKREFVNIIREAAGDESYQAYLRIKNDLKSKEVIPLEDAQSLLSEIKRRTKNIEHGKKK